MMQSQAQGRAAAAAFTKPLWPYAAGPLLTLGAGSLPYGRWINEFQDSWHLLAHEAIWWCLVAMALAYVARVERRPLASIGWRRPRLVDIPIAIAGGVLALALLVALINGVLPALHLSLNQSQAANIAAAPYWWRLVSVLRAATAEELLFRGYPMERLRELSGSRLLAALLPWAAFTLAHVGPWGWAHLLVAGAGGAVFTLLYLWRRNLWVNIVAHFIVDGAAFLLEA
jgi:membrane protease YdiL (CAAX protease family)